MFSKTGSYSCYVYFGCLRGSESRAQPGDTWTAVTFYSSNKRSSTQVAEGKSLPNLNYACSRTGTCNHRDCQSVSSWWSRLCFILPTLKEALSVKSAAEFCSEDWTKKGWCHKDNRIISPVFIDISVSVPHSLSRPNLTLWTGQKSHVMFSTRSRSSGTE